MMGGRAVNFEAFQSPPSVRKATRSLRNHEGRRHISIPAFREEGDAQQTAEERRKTFQSPPSVRKATDWEDICPDCQKISIPAFREEGDERSSPTEPATYLFQSPPSVRKATHPRRY